MKQKQKRRLADKHAGARAALEVQREKNRAGAEDRIWQKVWEDLLWEQDQWRLARSRRLDSLYDQAWVELLREQDRWCAAHESEWRDKPLHELTGSW